MFVPNNSTEPLNDMGLNSNFWTCERFMDTDVQELLNITIPHLPIKLFDTGVSAIGDFMDECPSHGGAVLELKEEGTEIDHGNPQR